AGSPSPETIPRTRCI
nr:immunoglobulin heavy chain junction region [Homo sapiens]